MTLMSIMEEIMTFFWKTCVLLKVFVLFLEGYINL